MAVDGWTQYENVGVPSCSLKRGKVEERAAWVPWRLLGDDQYKRSDSTHTASERERDVFTSVADAAVVATFPFSAVGVRDGFGRLLSRDFLRCFGSHY